MRHREKPSSRSRTWPRRGAGWGLLVAGVFALLGSGAAAVVTDVRGAWHPPDGLTTLVITGEGNQLEWTIADTPCRGRATVEGVQLLFYDYLGTELPGCGIVDVAEGRAVRLRCIVDGDLVRKEAVQDELDPIPELSGLWEREGPGDEVVRIATNGRQVRITFVGHPPISAVYVYRKGDMIGCLEDGRVVPRFRFERTASGSKRLVSGEDIWIPLDDR